MFAWLLFVNSVVAAVFVLLGTATILAGRPLLPQWTYVAATVVGLLGWLAWLFSSGGFSLSFRVPRPILVAWFLLATQLLPLEAGLVGWLGVRSPWRWGLLVVGIGGQLVPILISG